MKIFEERFYKLFKKKHGEKIYLKIKKEIINEANKEINDEYIANIFDIAYAEFLGISIEKLPDFLKNMMEIEIDNVKELSNKHQKSIKIIIKEIEEKIK